MVLHLSTATSTKALPFVPSELRQWATRYDRLHIDLGTGDGKFAIQLARRHPSTGVIGLDSNLDHLHGSRRKHPDNVRFERLDAIEWPLESIPVADTVTINFPYGSLLRGLYDGNGQLIERLDALLGLESRLEIRANERALIDTNLDPAPARTRIIDTLEQLDGLRIDYRELRQPELRSYPSSWSKRLGYGRAAPAFLIEAVRGLR